MAGLVRPKCETCGKWYRYNWDIGFYKNCTCEKKVEKSEKKG